MVIKIMMLTVMTIEYLTIHIELVTVSLDTFFCFVIGPKGKVWMGVGLNVMSSSIASENKKNAI